MQNAKHTVLLFIWCRLVFCRSRSIKVALIVSFIYFLFHCANRSHNCLIYSHTLLRSSNSPRACQTVLVIRSKGRVHHCSKLFFVFFGKFFYIYKEVKNHSTTILSTVCVCDFPHKCVSHKKVSSFKDGTENRAEPRRSGELVVSGS